MVKVVLNKCYGGFSVSRECAELMAKDGHAGAIEALARDHFFKGHVFKGDGYVCSSDEDRTDPILVKAVETLGSEKASGNSAQLSVVEIPDHIDWHIDDYDGIETVDENHKSWG